jgi:hypothetical protein
MTDRAARTQSCALLLAAALTLLATRAAANPVPIPEQRIIQDHFAPHLVLPELAIWRFETLTPYAGGGDLVCGHVNFQNSTRQYFGFKGFYAVVVGKKVTSSGIQATNAVQDPTGAFEFAYAELCQKK